MSTKQIIASNLTALGFANPSNAAISGKIAEALGYVIDTTLAEFENTKSQILSTVTSKNYGKKGYYTSAALAFQYGDSLVINPTTLEYYYPVIDETKKIIKQAAFFAANGQLFLKVATVDLTGNTIALSNDQYSAFVAYMKTYELPNAPVNYISSNANILYFQANATFYQTYDLPATQSSVNYFMNLFMKDFAFNGEFFNGDLQDYLKKNIPALRDFFIYNTTVDGIAFSGSTNLTSGYFNYSNEINIIYNAY